jgi:hypothetical protein
MAQHKLQTSDVVDVSDVARLTPLHRSTLTGGRSAT